MYRKKVFSSSINSIGYESGILEIEFTSGEVYQYYNVPEHIFSGLNFSFSKGNYFRERIKDFYTFTKL